MRIAVIGAGAFGSAAASKLAKNGFSVTLYEKEDRALQGATKNSQNRLHLGLHYPRDLQTAKQSVIGFKSFMDTYRDAVNLNFPNYYGIPESGSRVSPIDFENFAKTANIKIMPVEKKVIEELGLTLNHISQVWQCDEGVIDMQVFEEILIDDLNKYGVEVRYGREVTKVSKSDYNWIVLTKDGEEKIFDFVVICTYSNNKINIEVEEYKPREVVYQQTIIQVLKSDASMFGLTIVDGDYLTILPKGFSNEQLAYGPTLSTRRSERGTKSPEHWSPLVEVEIQDFQKKLSERINFWISEWNYEFSQETLKTTRTIEPDVEATDRRTSKITDISEGLIEVWAGKIDHCVDISENILNNVRNYKNQSRLSI